MNCKYMEEHTGICCNGYCPACADICPVPDRVEVCLYQEDEEEAE